MTRPDPLRPTLALGYDLVLAVDPEVYRITEDVNGRAWCFEMTDETREQIADAVEHALTHAEGPTPRAVERLEVEPGYLRVRYRPPDRDTADPRDVIDALRSTPRYYNDRHATDEDLDGFALVEQSYLGAYRPEDAPDREAFLDAHASGEAIPDVDAPVWAHDREADREDVLTPARRFSYEFVLPFDAAEMYDPDPGGITKPGPLPVEWDHDAVREVLELIVARKRPLWPARPENTPRVEIHPGFVAVKHITTDDANPVARAEAVRDALLAYNRYRKPAEDRGGRDARHPPIGFDGSLYIRALEHGETADAWLREHDLDAVDGEPTAPDPAPDPEADPPAEERGRFDALNPFSD